MNRMKTILITLVTLAVSLIALADTNAVVATAKKCPQTTLACVGVPVSDTAVSMELKAEVKEAATAAEAQYEKRYDELKDSYESSYANLRDDYDKFVGRLGNWLTGIAIFVALLGVGLPIVEHCRAKALFRWARDRIGREIVEARDSKKRAIQIIRKDSVEALHMCLLQGMLYYNHTSKDDESKNNAAMALMSILLCFYKTVDVAVRTGDETIVRKQIQGFKEFAERWSSNDDSFPMKIQIWEIAVGLMKNAEPMECKLSDLARILGDGSEEYKWFKDFFNKCFPGRKA